MLPTNSSVYYSHHQDVSKPPASFYDDPQFLSTSPSSNYTSNPTPARNSHSHSSHNEPLTFFDSSSYESTPQDDFFPPSFRYDENDEPFPYDDCLYSFNNKTPEGHKIFMASPIISDTNSEFIQQTMDQNLNTLIPEQTHEVRFAEIFEGRNEQPTQKVDLKIISKKITSKKITELKQTYKLKNAPFNVFTALKNGCYSYWNTQRDRYKSITRELTSTSNQNLIPALKKIFNECPDKARTFTAFGKYFKGIRDREALEFFRNILVNFLQKEEDVKEWLKGSKMNDTTQDNILQNTEQLISDFLKVLT